MKIAVKSNINDFFIELLYLDEPGSLGGSWFCRSNIFTSRQRQVVCREPQNI